LKLPGRYRDRLPTSLLATDGWKSEWRLSEPSSMVSSARRWLRIGPQLPISPASSQRFSGHIILGRFGRNHRDGYLTFAYPGSRFKWFESSGAGNLKDQPVLLQFGDWREAIFIGGYCGTAPLRVAYLQNVDIIGGYAHRILADPSP
jgi:hypothetical protein